MKKKQMNRSNYRSLLALLLLMPFCLHGQTKAKTQPEAVIQNIQSKAEVMDSHTIKLRWSPANAKAWLDGRKYGYQLIRYTMMIDSTWQNNPTKEVIPNTFKPAALPLWKDAVQKSDYAAVIAQALYGTDFDLSGKNSTVENIMNQSTELDQRFSTSLFMAEYDYSAAELAGWAWTDTQVKANERYLYRIILNRPNKIEGDTTAIYIGVVDKKKLEKPIGLNAVFGDKKVMLSWNYRLLSPIYHSYHIERKADQEAQFKRITHRPVTALNSQMSEIMFTDSLANNETTYSYRVIGLTSFDEESPASDTIRGHGKKTVSCVPHINSGDFVAKDKAHIYWEFECADMDLVRKFQVKRAKDIEGDYQTIIDSIPLSKREADIDLPQEKNYIELFAVNKDGSTVASFPFLLRQVDSIPPAIPSGLKVVIDSAAVAHLSWKMNTEPDFRGYRILRSFQAGVEKSSILSDFLKADTYTDTLSLKLANEKVYYQLTALDERYNESKPCQEVAAVKPNTKTPSAPIFTDYKISGDSVRVSWMVDMGREDVKYALTQELNNAYETVHTIFLGDNKTNTFTDVVSQSGTYTYVVIAQDSLGKKTFSPQPLSLDVSLRKSLTPISNLRSYVDRTKNYIELSWAKSPDADTYRIYKAEENHPLTIWKEVDATQNRVDDEHVSPGTAYTYTLLYITKEGHSSPSKTITVNY